VDFSDDIPLEEGDDKDEESFIFVYLLIFH